MIYTPKIINNLSFDYENFSIDLDLRCNLLLLYGDSGVGKSYLYQALETQSNFNEVIYTINYNTKEDVNTIIKTKKGKLFVIDNADLILDADIRRYISFDYNNQYIIIGRDTRDLMIVKQNVVKMHIESNRLKFVYYD